MIEDSVICKNIIVCITFYQSFIHLFFSYKIQIAQYMSKLYYFLNLLLCSYYLITIVVIHIMAAFILPYMVWHLFWFILYLFFFSNFFKLNAPLSSYGCELVFPTIDVIYSNLLLSFQYCLWIGKKLEWNTFLILHTKH